MKKIVFFIALVISFAASAQLPTISGVTNRNTREQIIDGYFFHGLRVAKDTFTTPDSAWIAYKNGNFQFKLPSNWATMPNLILTNPLPLDHIALFDATGRTLINVPGAPATSCIVFDDGWYPTVVDLDSLRYRVTESHFTVVSTGVHYIYPATIVTLPVGTASAGQGRKDYVGITAGGPSSLQGANGVIGVAATPEYDPCDFYPLIQVDINEADVVPSVPSTTRKVYDEHTGPAAEATMSTFGTTTVNFDQTTNAPPSGTKDLNVTAAANNAGFRATYADTIFVSTISSISGRFRTNANINAATNWSVRLRFGTLVSNVVQITARGVAKTGQNNIWQYFIFNISDFPGFPRFTAIDFIRNGTGTINHFFDDIKIQKIGASVIPAAQAALTTVNGQTGSYTTTGPGGVLNVIGANGITTSQSGNTLTIDGSGLAGAFLPLLFTGDNLVDLAGHRIDFNYDDGAGGGTNFHQDNSQISFGAQTGTDNTTWQMSATGFAVSNTIDISGNNVTRLAIGANAVIFDRTSPGDVDDTLHFDLKILPYGDPASFTKMLVYDPSTGAVGQVDAAGGGGGSDSPDRINGSATGDVTADMGNNKFWINQSGSNSIRFASDDGAGNTSFFSMNGSGASFNYNDNEFNAELTGYRVVLDGTNTFTYDADYSANYTSLSLITRGDAPAIETGTSAPGSTPVKVGDIYVDTSAKKLYFATGTSSSADWTIAN